MDNLEIHPNIVEKLRNKHQISVEEVHECFANVSRGFLIDTREHNQTDPVTHWFIEETDRGRDLLIVFMHFNKGNRFVLKTAFVPTKERKKLYLKMTKK